MSNKAPHWICIRLTILAIGMCLLGDLQAQRRPERYFDGQYQVFSLKQDGLKFKVFDFDASRLDIKVAYFGSTAGEKYEEWQRRNRAQVLCFFAAGFAQQYENGGTPLGLSIESGQILNRTLDAEMDGLLEISRSGQLSALDIEEEAARRRYQLRSIAQRGTYVSTVIRERSSVCQSQLLYSASHGSRMGPERYGKRASRRFLVIATDRNRHRHYLIVDLVESAFLNEAAQKALAGLQAEGYTVEYLFNHDTGSRNIMNAFDDQQNRLYAGPIDYTEATQLLVFYLN